MTAEPGSPVTIVLACFNHEPYLLDALASVEAQTVTPARVVVCDDASTDGSAGLIEAWARSTALPEVRLVLNPTNRGLTATLNTALAQVDTEFFAYMSTDDVLKPHRLDRQLRLISGDGDLAFVYSDATRIDEAGVAYQEPFSAHHDGWHPAIDSYRALLRSNWIPAVSILARTEAVRAVGGYDETLFFEDYDLLLRLARRHRFAHDPDELVCFREVTDSLGHRKFRVEDEDYALAKVRILSKHLDADPRLVGRIRAILVSLQDRGTRDRHIAAPLRRLASRDFDARIALRAAAATTRTSPLLRTVARGARR